MHRPRPHVSLPVAALLLVTVLGCSGDAPSAGSSGAAAIRLVDAPSLPPTVDALPPIDVAGFGSLLEELRGFPVVVNFWATWCDPCKREIPLLVEAARTHADTVQFVGVDLLDDRGSAQAFLSEMDVPYPNVFDATGEVRTSVGGLGQPVTLFYDADGNEVAKIEGEMSQAVLVENLEAISG